jgi:hypothetical protein
VTAALGQAAYEALTRSVAARCPKIPFAPWGRLDDYAPDDPAMERRADWEAAAQAVLDAQQRQPAPGADRYRGLLDEIGVMAANAPEDGDSFAVLERIAMMAAAADVPDSAPARASSPKLGDLAISACEIDGHAPHAARVTVDYGLQVTSFCLPPEHGEFLGDALASGKLAAAQAELDKVQRGAATLGMVVVRQARDLYAMHIDVSRGDLEAVKQRVLNAIPDVDDNEPAEQWNGTETGSEWLERTRDGS